MQVTVNTCSRYYTDGELAIGKDGVVSHKLGTSTPYGDNEMSGKAVRLLFRNVAAENSILKKSETYIRLVEYWVRFRLESSSFCVGLLVGNSLLGPCGRRAVLKPTALSGRWTNGTCLKST
ncbi:hypothetical protein Y032_0020g44 [Ancylostoma ceylanicum]|uniref:Uncharacterized protein n=1 Tax=Ancylostoma ceylanicum TaxID=53326 RepID=A0A016V385_9BILA|nr:hypothetical protein Y032_0020g44 [Ancylostoma ceylanicum]